MVSCEAIIIPDLMEHAKSTVLTTSGHSQPAFNLEYLKKNLSHIDISVPSYENDFMDHTVQSPSPRTTRLSSRRTRTK